MKVLIFSGGTGSIALQKGLVDEFGIGYIDYTVLINPQDNGKSTGVVRQVVNGNIPGPSDLRKNQLLRHELIHGKTALLKFLDLRLTCNSAVEMEASIRLHMCSLPCSESNKLLSQGIDAFFALPKSKQVDYIDFSVSNIIYAGLAAANGNSLEKAGEIFDKILDIPADCVVMNSDKSLFLTAITESGHRILDEGDIVAWNNPDDKIHDIQFLDVNGKIERPLLSHKAAVAIAEADIIIFSAGTQWSSLIPTYVTYGIYDAIKFSNASKYLIMNVAEDKDSIGVGAAKWIKILEGYLPLLDVKILTSCNAVPSMRNAATDVDISEIGSTVHNSKKVVRTIFDDYFRNFIGNYQYVFDYDDTLVPRNAPNSEIARSNAYMFCELSRYVSTCICTGNSIAAIKGFTTYTSIALRVYADGGINEYTLSVDKDGSCHMFIADSSNNNILISDTELHELTGTLESIGIPVDKIHDRRSAMVAIKPVDPEYRRIIINLLRKIESISSKYSIVASGRSTIEIAKRAAHKGYTIAKLQAIQNVVYIGDEFTEGNDNPVLSVTGVKTYAVSSPKDTNVLLTTLVRNLVR